MGEALCTYKPDFVEGHHREFKVPVLPGRVCWEKVVFTVILTSVYLYTVDTLISS